MKLGLRLDVTFHTGEKEWRAKREKEIPSDLPPDHSVQAPGEARRKSVL